MTQTLLEGSKLLSKSYTTSSPDKDENINTENHSLIRTLDLDLSTCGRESISTRKKIANGSSEFYQRKDDNINKSISEFRDCTIEPDVNDTIIYPLNGECTDNINNVAGCKHLYPKVVVQNSNDLSDLDSDEEDFQLRMHSKSDSGQGSSVETSSVKSGTQDFYQVDVRHDYSIGASNAGVVSEILDNVLDDTDLALYDSFARRHSSISSRVQEIDKKLEDTNFTDVPLNTPNTPSPKRPPVNTYTPTSNQVGTAKIDDVSSPQAILKPPMVTDTPVNERLLRKTNQKSWKIFGKVAVPVTRETSQNLNSGTLGKQKRETVGSSTTALIFENRPSHLPPKSTKEELRHRQQYEEMIAFAKRKELKDKENEKKKLKQRQKLEDQLSNIVKTWKEEIIPNWDTCKNTKKVRELWWAGVPPSVRGKVWQLAIGNDLNITPELFRIFQANAKERIRNQKNPEPVATLHDSESSLVVSKENTVGLITLDVSRTFPGLCIFQKGGPYHEPLKNLLSAYTCFRPDVGYVQGMSFLAAMLLLNIDLVDAFVAFSNLLNRPCQMAFFMVDQPMMEAYFRTFDALLEEQIPRLYVHMKNENLSNDIYLIDWVFTLFSKSLPLDTACRVWDLFCRDGEEFLFRTALGILLMNEEVLLEMEFFRLAQYLTKLSNAITSDELFKYIEKINFSKQKMQSTLAHFKALARKNPPPPT